jgi:hypothetical protein
MLLRQYRQAAGLTQEALAERATTLARTASRERLMRRLGLQAREWILIDD